MQASVLVFRSGKVITGRVLSEDADVVRFQDDSGVGMSIKKSFLDIEKTREANKNLPAAPQASLETKTLRPTTLAEVARLNRESRSGHSRLLTNADVAYGPASSSMYGKPPYNVDLSNVKDGELDTRLRKAEQSYDRLKGQCRAAGGEGTSVRHSATYMVGGKPVRVEGNWADPAAVGRAKQVCARAMQTQNEMAALRAELERRQESTGKPAPETR